MRRLTWQPATVAETVAETADVRTLVLDAPSWPGHVAGQHVDVRLTAEDGYQAQRSYSIASAPGASLAITVQRLADGEVSPYLVDEVRPGDELELRGPIGGYFVWRPGSGRPLLLVGGGSGVVPLMAMVRARAQAGDETPARLLVSSRTLADVIYREELDRLAGGGLEVVHTLTRGRPAGWMGYSRRVDAAMLAEVAWPPDAGADTFVCGSTPFVERVAQTLVELGHQAGRIRTERYGGAAG